MALSIEVKQSVNDTSYVSINGQDYLKENYEIYYGSLEQDNAGDTIDTTVKVGIRSKYGTEIIVHPRYYYEYDNGVTSYASLSALTSDFADLLGTESTAVITQVADNYSSLIAGSSIGDIAYTLASEGTKWLPFTLGGTYYPAGFYQWNGATWVSDRNGIAESLFNLTEQAEDSLVRVKSASDLTGTLDSTKVYFIDGIIDMGSTSIYVPESGLTILGYGYDISKLISTTANHTMFVVDPAGTYSGNMIVEGLTIYSSGTNSKIFDLDNAGNSGALELDTVNLGDFPVTSPSLGEIANYRQFRVGNFAAINYTQGLTFSGTIGGVAIRDAIILSSVAGSTFLLEGTSLSITDGMVSNMNALSLTGTSKWCNFREANFGADAFLALTGFRTNADDAIPNISAKSTSAYYKSCVGVDNTFVGASWTLTTETATNITASQTLFKAAGTTTPSLDAWFTHPANNRLQYNGKRTVKVDVLAYVQLTSANTESFSVEARQWDSSASAWIDIRTLPIETALKLLGDRRGGGTVIGQALLDEGDYIELWVRDDSATGTANPTMVEQSTLTLTERI